MNGINSEIEKKFKALQDGKKIPQILSESGFFINSPITKAEISILKSYKDERSYSLTAIYTLLFAAGQEKKLVATANSDGTKEYAWLATKIIFENFGRHDEIAIPEPIGYLEKYGLFLREFTPGETLARIIKKDGGLKKSYADWLIRWLIKFQKISPAGEIRPGLDFDKTENNLSILKNRGENISDLNTQFRSIKDRINDLVIKSGQTMVHGDFSPVNVIIKENKLSIIDFESAHLGDKLLDVADFMSHLSTLEEIGLDYGQRVSSCDNLIESYQTQTKPLNKEEKEKIDLYRRYFDLLIKTHKLVWN